LKLSKYGLKEVFKSKEISKLSIYGEISLLVKGSTTKVPHDAYIYYINIIIPCGSFLDYPPSIQLHENLLSFQKGKPS
jgi:hypothetical protein